MAGNTIRINNFVGLEWYVGDSKMDELTAWLEENGIKTEDADMVVKPERDDDESFKGQVLQLWIEEMIYPGKTEDFIQQI